MLRGLLIYAALGLYLTPALNAQQVTVCVFQTKPWSQLNVADELSSQLLMTAPAFGVVKTVGIAKKDEDAEAHKRGCSWIVTIWHQVQMGGDFNRERPFWPALALFNLLKTGSRKTIADGNSDGSAPVPYAKWAGEIAQKISRQNEEEPLVSVLSQLQLRAAKPASGLFKAQYPRPVGELT